MKRSPLPRRQTPLARATGDLIRRTRLKPVSAKRQREALGRAAVRAAVFERDEWTCRLGWSAQVIRMTTEATRRFPHCYGPLTPHHLLKTTQGGRYTEENLVSLCATHNDWVEQEPLVAWRMGLVIRRDDTAEHAALRRVAAGIGP